MWKILKENNNFKINNKGEIYDIKLNKTVIPYKNGMVDINGKTRSPQQLLKSNFDVLSLLTLRGEEWKTIVEYPDYKVSNLGRVYSELSAKILKAGMNNKGYQIVVLTKNNKRTTKTVHRLVLKTFSPNNDNYLVNHIDGNKLNNKLSNLEWVSYSGNLQHAWDTGLRKYVGDKIHVYIKATGETKTYNSYKEASLDLRGNKWYFTDWKRLDKKESKLYKIY